MAKKPEETQADDLGGLPPELQVGSNNIKTQPPAELPQKSILSKDSEEEIRSQFSDDDHDEDEKICAEDAPEFVVVSGYSVQHDGIKYPENSVIEVSGEDAERLIQLGVIVRLDDLREQLLSGSPVNVQDGVKIHKEA